MTKTVGERMVICVVATLVGTSLLYGFSVSSPSLKLDEWLVSFWLEDLPPLSGVVRIALWSGLLATALISHHARPHLGDSPLQAPMLYKYTLPEFFSLEGCMRLFGRKWITYTRLLFIRNLTILGWICCIIGFGGQIAPAIVAIGMVVQHGVVSGCIGTSHRWYVPVYLCVFLAFQNANSTLSVDQYLFTLYPDTYPFPPAKVGVHVAASSLGRKLAMWSGLCTLVYGGITKMLNAGVKWMDGLSLAYYVSSEENGRVVLLKSLLNKSTFLSLFLSVNSIILECGSIVALFFPWTRPPVFVSAAGFHLGIWLTMWPNYFPQTWCYGVGIHWPGEQSIPQHSYPASGTPLLAAWMATAIFIFLTAIAFTRIEFWPFTGIPMYSFYRYPNFHYKYFHDLDQAYNTAVEHLTSGYPNALAWSNQWIELRLTNRKDPVSFVNLRDLAVDHCAASGVLNKQWRRTLHNIAAADMATQKSPQHLDYLATGNAATRDANRPAMRWLKDHVAALRNNAHWKIPQWASEYGDLHLIVHVKSGSITLACLPWNYDQSKKTQ